MLTGLVSSGKESGSGRTAERVAHGTDSHSKGDERT